MSDDKKAIEWFIDDSSVAVLAFFGGLSSNGIHVIEYSAYAALRKENEELKRCLAEFNMDALTKRENNERKLRESLNAAIEYLELASKRSSYVWTSGGDYFPSDYANEGKIMLAQELLTDLKKKMGNGE